MTMYTRSSRTTTILSSRKDNIKHQRLCAETPTLASNVHHPNSTSSLSRLFGLVSIRVILSFVPFLFLSCASVLSNALTSFECLHVRASSR